MSSNIIQRARTGFYGSLLCLFLVPAAVAQMPFQLLVRNGAGTSLIPNNATLALAADAIGKPSSLTIVMAYQGFTAAAVNQPQLFGSNSFTVSALTVVPATLNPGDSLSLTVQFKPADVREATAQLTIPYTEKGPASQAPSTNGSITLALNGTVPGLAVSYSLPADGNVVTVDTGNTIAFPSTVVGASIMASVGIVNRGSGTGPIQSISISGNPFSLQSTPLLPLMVAPGAAVQFGVRYSPSQVGNNSGALQIVFPDRTVTLGLQGTGIPSLLTYQLLQDAQPVPIIPGQLLSFPDTGLGARSSLSILAKNTSSGPVTVSAAAVSGSGFAITDGPILPVTLNVNDVASFTIGFVPTQAGSSTGRLRVGNDSFDLAGKAIGVQLLYSYTMGSASTPVLAGGTVLFSPSAVGQTASDGFTVRNTGTAAATIVSVGISGTQTAFTIANQPSLPVSLSAGQSVHFSLAFSPVTTGLSTATLLVDSQQFQLSGFGSPPAPIPAYQFSGASGNQSPFTQLRIGLSLASGYPLEVDGKLTLSVHDGSFAADPAVQFSTGGRVVAFTIPANAIQAIFPGGDSEVNLQTGTVAGTITVIPSFALPSGLDITPANPTPLSLSIPAGPPYLSNALVTEKSPTTATLQISGYAPTRTLRTLQFRFLAQSSANVVNGALSLNIEPNAQNWFSSVQSQNFGGQFMVTVPFSFASGQSSTSSPLSLLQAVSIKAGNDSGTSNELMVPFAP